MGDCFVGTCFSYFPVKVIWLWDLELKFLNLILLIFFVFLPLISFDYINSPLISFEDNNLMDCCNLTGQMFRLLFLNDPSC